MCYYYHGHGNVWIGSAEGAAAVARGETPASGSFVAVFNASGSEAAGITLEPQVRARGLLYDTLLDSWSGMTLGDCAERAAPEDVAQAMADADDVYRTPHSTQTCTDVAFAFFMHEASRKIAALADGAERRGGAALVYCARGHNRSAASVVAYAALSAGEPVAEVVGRVRAAAREYGCAEALTNERFVALLAGLRRGSAAAAAARVAYRQEHADIMCLTRAAMIKRSKK